MRVPFLIYADLECLLEKMHLRQNNLENCYTEKKIKDTPSGYSLLHMFSFDTTKKSLIVTEVKIA